MKRSIFKGMFTPLIRDAFNLGLQNDVIDQATNHQTAGWKGLRAVQVQEMAEKGSKLVITRQSLCSDSLNFIVLGT
ncbi:MAG: hypothetical protein ACLQU3_28640 [Limisphaerales bacterium]